MHTLNSFASPVQAVLSSRLQARLQALASAPPYTRAPALVGLLQALHAALDRYESGSILGDPQLTGPGLQVLYAGLLQQALAQLMDNAAASFAALPVMGVADNQPAVQLDKQLLQLLGQVGE